jgi:ABC-type sugar transport system ATPase subunit/ribose/xylose/arabinose/galactoside ABC-type transport system permease subunit
MASILDVRNLSRRFPGVVALDNVSLTIEPGQVHALVGENGAGKSTLINIIAGVLAPDQGEILLEGKPAGLTDPVTARQKGIVTVHQEAELFPTLSVAENMSLGTGLPRTRLGRVRWNEVHRRAERAVAPLGHHLDVRAPASQLSVAERHLTQVAAAIVEKAKIVILDEPTSVLTLKETQWLFEQIDRLKSQGVGIIYISHRQEEIFRLSDTITVLRDGKVVWNGPTSSTNSASLVHAMVGRTMDLPSRRADATLSDIAGPVRLHVRGLTDANSRYRDISLELRAGEVFGLYGLVGSGRSEFAQGIFGMTPIASGTIEVDGKPVTIRRPLDATNAGIAYVPEDRLRQAVFRRRSIRDNAVLASLSRWSIGPFVRRSRESAATIEQARRFRVKHRTIDDAIEQLSGGNQQKVVLARWVLTQPKVLILDEPTRGVDVAAKADIHALIRQLASDGAAILLISSEIPEVLAHADRIGIFREGRLVTTIDGNNATAVDIARPSLPETAAEPVQPVPSGAGRFASRLGLTQLGWLAGIIFLILLLATTTEGRFTTSANLANLANNLAPRAILALASALVIMAGGIDISVGSLLALAAAAGGMTMKAWGDSPASIPLGIGTGLLVGVIGGAINGATSILGRIHPIVVTLGTLTIYRGLVIQLTGSGVISGLPDSFGQLATSSYLELSGSVWILLATLAVGHFIIAHSVWGREILAVGSSPSAARLAGISKTKTWLRAFSAAGLLVGLAGMLDLAQNRTLQPTMGTGYELRAIAAAVIGGVAIEGGRGSVPGVVLGALLLVLMENGLVLWQVKGARYDLVIGGLLLFAILIDRFTRRKRP